MHNLYHTNKLSKESYDNVRQEHGLSTISELQKTKGIVTDSQTIPEITQVKMKLPQHLTECVIDSTNNKELLIKLFIILAETHYNLDYYGTYSLNIDLNLRLTNTYLLEKILYFLIRHADQYKIPTKELYFAYNKIVSKSIEEVLVGIKKELEAKFQI